MKISAVVITYNEQNNIEACLKGLGWADERIVIDSSSTDNTVQIARNAGAKIFIHAFTNFADMRVHALKKARGDWILYIDADERVTPSLAAEIKGKIEQQNYSIYTLKRKNFYLGREWPYIEEIKRLFKRDSLKGWFGDVHESPISQGTVGSLDEYLLHYTHNDISSMVKKTNKWSEIEAKLRFDSHHPPVIWWRFFRVMLTAFWEYYIHQGGYKAGIVGLIEGIYQSFSIFITYVKLWEMQQKEK